MLQGSSACGWIYRCHGFLRMMMSMKSNDSCNLKTKSLSWQKKVHRSFSANAVYFDFSWEDRSSSRSSSSSIIIIIIIIKLLYKHNPWPLLCCKAMGSLSFQQNNHTHTHKNTFTHTHTKKTHSHTHTHTHAHTRTHVKWHCWIFKSTNHHWSIPQKQCSW